MQAFATPFVLTYVEDSSLFARLLNRITLDEATDCWLWQGAKTTAGYGEVMVSGQMWYVHRLVYSLKFKVLPPEIHHMCRKRACCNPDHLKPFETHGQHLIYQNTGTHYPKVQIRTHCSKGHEWVPENTYWRSNFRQCRACRKSANKAWKIKNRARR